MIAHNWIKGSQRDNFCLSAKLIVYSLRMGRSGETETENMLELQMLPFVCDHG